MSIPVIRTYHQELANIRRIGRTNNEEPLSRATENLITGYARAQNLFFVRQPPRKTPNGHTIRPDGMIGDQFFDWGYWEAKDSKDDLDQEIAAKFAKGYPSTNTLFEDTQTAVLYQDGQEIGRISMADEQALDALLTRFVTYQPPQIQKFRESIENFKREVPQLAQTLRDIIEQQAATNRAYQQASADFLALCRKAINPSVTQEDVREMLIQHILTQDIFNVIFSDPDFHRENAIAKKLGEVVGTFYKQKEKRTIDAKIRPFYEVINARAAQIESHHEKQRFLKTLYETFYRAYNPKAADRLGIVYTPNEIVRFMIESADHLCYTHFGKGLSDKGVHILDPATGTGTYIAELLEYWAGVQDRHPDRFAHKYQHELHCNEVSILPYYIANLNIEYTYQALTGQYAPFENIVFVDTLDNMGFATQYVKQMGLFALADENSERIQRQNEREISVIIGNPPYNAWQENYNKQNPNRPYQHIDERIKQTYVKYGTAQNQIALYDMYTRFLRWASDRLGDEGIIAFVSNSSFIDSQSYDGFRKVVADEFSELWVINLKGNARTSGERRRREGGNVFDDAIRVGIAIYFLVRRADKSKPFTIHYNAIADYARSEEKRAYLLTSLEKLRWETIKPDERHTWLNQTDNDFETLLPLVDKEVKAGRGGNAIFRLFSSGVKTQRDEWVIDFSREQLAERMRFFVDLYNRAVADPDIPDKMAIKWDADMEQYRIRGIRKLFSDEQIVPTLYRPFVKSWLYFDKHFNGRTYQNFAFFPHASAENKVIGFNVGSTEFMTFSAQCVFLQNSMLVGAGSTQCLALYRYDDHGNRVDNITDWALAQFQARYAHAGGASVRATHGSPLPQSPQSPQSPSQQSPPRASIQKRDIFHYVYAVLHHPAYRTKYELNLKRDFPRIPFYDDFWQWAQWGEQLMALHIGYESADLYPIERHDEDPATVRKAYKAWLRRKKGSTDIEIDTLTTLSNVPEVAYTYRLGNRSAIEWVLDRYKERTPSDPTIREQFNTYRFADYKEEVIVLLQRVITVSIETMAIVGRMPDK